MPLPLAMMIPFMGMQSAVMMKQAGENWQYGKRLQSSLSNEEFNKQTQVTIFEKNQAEIRQMIPTMEQSIRDMRAFQDFIIVEMIELMRRGLETGLGAIFGLTPEQSNEFFGGTNPPSLSDPAPAPTGETTPEGISLTIEQVQAMSVNTLLFETQASQITKYTDATQQHMLTEKASRASDTNIIDTGTEEITTFKADLFATETLFLQDLTTVTFQTMWNPYITSFTPTEQTNIIQHLQQVGLFAGMTVRNRSSGSDTELQSFQATLASLRTQFQSASTTSAISQLQSAINKTHIRIWFWQLIYI